MINSILESSRCFIVFLAGSIEPFLFLLTILAYVRRLTAKMGVREFQTSHRSLLSSLYSVGSRGHYTLFVK